MESSILIGLDVFRLNTIGTLNYGHQNIKKVMEQGVPSPFTTLMQLTGSKPIRA